MSRSIGLSMVLFLVGSIAGSVANADESAVATGGELFGANCVTCHSIEKGVSDVGPTLYQIIGRRAAAVPGYGYSSAIKSSGIVWTEPNLRHYLMGPQEKIRCHNVAMGRVRECLGVAMAFRGFSDPKDAVAVVEYLKSLNGKE